MNKDEYMNVYYPFNFCSLETFQNNMLSVKGGGRRKDPWLDRLVVPMICCEIAGKTTLCALVSFMVKSQIIIIYTFQKVTVKIKLCKGLRIRSSIQ